MVFILLVRPVKNSLNFIIFLLQKKGVNLKYYKIFEVDFNCRTTFSLIFNKDSLENYLSRNFCCCHYWRNFWQNNWRWFQLNEFRSSWNKSEPDATQDIKKNLAIFLCWWRIVYSIIYRLDNLLKSTMSTYCEK